LFDFTRLKFKSKCGNVFIQIIGNVTDTVTGNTEKGIKGEER
jgi:hypothetical protein